MIQIQRLEGFYWVARAEGYARAARAFPYPITQPGVHQQVKKLEAEIGTPLFERIGKDRVVLTASGRALFDVVAPFFEQLEAVVSSIRSGQVGGTLRVHAAGQVLRQLLPPWINRLRKKAPGVQIHLQEVGNAEIDELRRGEADMLVDYLPFVPEDVETLKVGEVHAFLVVPRSHPVARRARIRLQDLHGETFIAYPPHRRHRALQMRGLDKQGVVPSQTLAASSSDTILALVQAGLGFSLVPSPSPKGPKHPGVRTVPFRDDEAHFPIVAAWRSTASKSPLIRAFLDAAPAG
jgi:DNA-binding transcriptional LysR family regulator